MSLSFADFQNIQKEFSDHICQELFDILEDCRQHGLDTNSLILKLGEVSKKIKSQIFRVAIVGEFSRGKSTLINALVGEEIQVTRAIACSGVITVLKYGKEKRIICYYKNGSQKEIDFEEYKNLSTIPKEAAIKHRKEELARLEIKQIIFEHPNLELCKNGIELVDSPGLNEHPERAEITKNLLTNTDAVIFITFASAVLAETERNLIFELKGNLTNENKSVPSLFIVVNQMDNLKTEEDVKDVIKEFALVENSIVSNETRIHFISAQEAFKAIINKEDNEFLQSFQDFVKALESFLVDERGVVKISQATQEINNLVNNFLDFTQNYQDILHKRLEEIKRNKKLILEQIGELSGQAILLKKEVYQLVTKTQNEINEKIKLAWNYWINETDKSTTDNETLNNIIAFSFFGGNLSQKSSWAIKLQEKSYQWKSDKKLIFDQKNYIADFVEYFKKDLFNIINEWASEQLQNIIIDNLIELNSKIDDKIDIFKQEILNKDQKIFKNLEYNEFHYQFNLYIEDFFLGELGDYIGGIISGTIAGFIAYGFLTGGISVILGALAALIIGSGNVIKTTKNMIRNVVLNKCIEEFLKIEDKMINNLVKSIYDEIEQRFYQKKLESLEKITSSTITEFESQLQQLETEYKQQLTNYETEVNFLNEKRQQITAELSY